MTDSHLYQELHKHVREMNSLLKTHAGKRAPKPRQKHDHTPTGMADISLLKRCAEAFNTTAEEIISKSREQNVSLARHLYCYIRHTQYGVAPEHVGEELGRHRTTMLNSIKKAIDLLEVDRNFRKKYEEILSHLRM
jgi:chromosomal replication initiation ATPase DnaA